jgi:hypothetical protein
MFGLEHAIYVVMPEHVHLLLGEPVRATLAQAIQALKLSVAVRRVERPFWQARYYDFNVHSQEKTSEKLKYLHRNPVSSGLVSEPGDWSWSSFRHYATGEKRTVEIESFWTAWERKNETLTPVRVIVQTPVHPGFQNPGPGAPAGLSANRPLDPGHPPSGLFRRDTLHPKSRGRNEPAPCSSSFSGDLPQLHRSDASPNHRLARLASGEHKLQRR